MKELGKDPWDIVLIICAVTTVLSTVVYLATGYLIPGLSPMTLAAGLLIICLKLKKRKGGESSDMLFFVIFVASILNMIVGVMQIYAFFAYR